MSQMLIREPFLRLPMPGSRSEHLDLDSVLISLEGSGRSR
jgi:hypothetical protein